MNKRRGQKSPRREMPPTGFLTPEKLGDPPLEAPSDSTTPIPSRLNAPKIRF